MAKLIYTFSYDTETKEAVTAGNIPTAVAIKILQDILIAELSGQTEPKSNVEEATHAQRRPDEQ